MKHYDLTDIFGYTEGQRNIFLRVNLDELYELYAATSDARTESLHQALNAKTKHTHDFYMTRHHKLINISNELNKAYKEISENNSNYESL